MNIGDVPAYSGDFTYNFMALIELEQVYQMSFNVAVHTNDTWPHSARAKVFFQSVKVGSTHTTTKNIHIYAVFIPGFERQFHFLKWLI